MKRMTVEGFSSGHAKTIIERKQWLVLTVKPEMDIWTEPG